MSHAFFQGHRFQGKASKVFLVVNPCSERFKCLNPINQECQYALDSERERANLTTTKHLGMSLEQEKDYMRKNERDKFDFLEEEGNQCL